VSDIDRLPGITHLREERDQARADAESLAAALGRLLTEGDVAARVDACEVLADYYGLRGGTP